MKFHHGLSVVALLSLVTGACALNADQGAESIEETSNELTQADTWVHLDASTGLRNATLSAVNGGKLRCANGQSADVCKVAKLVLPADCKWECQENLVSQQGEAILRGRFSGTKFTVSAGFDSAQRGMGSYPVYVMRAPATCTQAPCPANLSRQKLNSSAPADSLASLNFATAADPNFVADPARGYDRTSTVPGLPVSGRIVNGAFAVDRVWRLETPLRACDPQLTARARAYIADAFNLVEYRTVSEAENAPNSPDAGRPWLVRSAESPASVTFTSGINDLWSQKFSIAKSDCKVTILAEH
jgi:hypothetical protein